MICPVEIGEEISRAQGTIPFLPTVMVYMFMWQQFISKCEGLSVHQVMLVCACVH